MKQQQDYANTHGYAMVVLLVFVIVTMTLISAAVNIMLIVTQSASEGELSVAALSVAESGAEEALLRTVRDPLYSGGVFTIEGDTVQVISTGSGLQRIIQTRATISATAREAVVHADFSEETLVIDSWVVQ